AVFLPSGRIRLAVCLSNELMWRRILLLGLGWHKGSDSSAMINDISNMVILAARLSLAPLFLIFGWRKLTDYSGTVSQMVRDGLPMPILATAIAIFMELPVAFAVAIGAFTRASAVLLALYTLGTSLVEHRYWTVKGAGDS